VVDGDADGPGKVLSKSCRLDLLERETASQPLLHVVLERGAPHDRPEGLDGPGRDGGGLLNPGRATADLPGGLVEPGLDVPLPILVEMGIGNHLVAFGRHDGAGGLV
jgi:hypothetical protein